VQYLYNNELYNITFKNLDLDPMTLILDLDLDIVNMYQTAKNEVYMSRLS